MPDPRAEWGCGGERRHERRRGERTVTPPRRGAWHGGAADFRDSRRPRAGV